MSGGIVINNRRKVLEVAAWSLAALLTLAAVYLHAVRMLSAGALWRDEINTLRIATLPWNEIWASLDYDSFPLAGPILVRAWSTAGLAETPTALRGFGLLVGVAVLATFWLHAWRMKCGPPLVSIALFGLSVVTIRYGDSIRSYGVGLLFILLTYIAIAEVLKDRTPVRVMLAGLAAILAVQCLYQNAILLLAIGIAGAIVAWWRKDRTTALTVLAIGAVAAVSLLPYVGPLRRAGEWSSFMGMDITLQYVGLQLKATTTQPNKYVSVAWIIAAVLAAGTTLFFSIRAILRSPDSPAQIRKRMREQRRQQQADQTEQTHAGETDLPPLASMPQEAPPLLAYATLAVGLCWLMMIIFWLDASLAPKPWYLLSLLGLAVYWFDLTLAALPLRVDLSIVARLVLGIAAGATTFYGAAENLRTQPTNAAEVARVVSERAQADDLVVVLPWHFGVSWDYYYTGQAEWTTAPPIADSTIHRFDLLKEQIEAGASLEEVFARMEQKLKAGHSVWVVGFLWPSNLRIPPALTTDDKSSFDVTQHLLRWAIEMVNFLTNHAVEVETPIELSPDFKPSKYEFLNLWRFEGWQDAPPESTDQARSANGPSAIMRSRPALKTLDIVRHRPET